MDGAVVAALLVGLGAVAVYRTTLLPGVGAWDTAEAQVVLPLMGTMHPTGFPAYVVLGWLASVLLSPLGSPAFTANLLSALLAGFAAGVTVLVLRRLGVPLLVGIASAAGLALTPFAWAIASAADAHALHLALVVAVTAVLLRWGALVAERRERPEDLVLRARGDRAIVLAAAVFGVALANHGLSLLLVPAVGLYVLAVEPAVIRRPRVVAAALGACLGTAALLYPELPLRAGPFPAPLVYGHPDTWSGFWDVVLARQFQGDVGGLLWDLPAKAGRLADLAGAQLGPLVALVPVGLAVTAWRHPRYALLSFTATAVTCLFAASYANAAIERYYLGPLFFAWTWLAVLAGTVVDRLEPDRLAPARVAAAGMIAAALVLPTGLALDARWHAVDRSRETVAQTWLDEAFAAMAPDAVVVSWWSYSTTMWYGQLVEGRRPDIRVEDDRILLDEGLGNAATVIGRFLGERPVYVIRAQESDVIDLARTYAIEPVGRPGNLYRVTGRLETPP